MDSLNEIIDAWEQDTQFSTNLGRTAQDLAALHAKYERVLSRHSIKLRQAEDNVLTLRRNKWLWISGKLSKDDLKLLGWDPFEMKLLKNQYDFFIDTDPDVIKLGQVAAVHKEIVRLCTSIIWAISNRNKSIGKAIDHERFLAGA